MGLKKIMAAPTGTMTTYQEVNLREQLLDELTDISPDANPLSTVLPASPQKFFCGD
jgi:hypothetical protein